MKCSICMATFNHAPLLRKTLRSIFAQRVPFAFEVIVANDGSTDETAEVLDDFPKVRAIHLPAKSAYVNPARARNAAYRQARGEVLICQSDDVLHVSEDTIERLCHDLRPDTFIIAGVRSADGEGVQGWYSHSVFRPSPFFFLGSLFRTDLYAVGGNDERFVAPGYDDNWFGDCLLHGRGLKQVNRDDIRGMHQTHDRSMQGDCRPSGQLYSQLFTAGKFHTEDAPWPLF